MNEEDIIVVGKISGVYGVKGWVRVYSHTEPRKGILDYSPWLIETNGEWQPRELIDGQSHGKGIIAQIEHCDDRDIAYTLIDRRIAIHRDQLAELEDDEYYWGDLEGLTVNTVDGQELGKISHLFETGANDVIVVKGERERLIPFLQGSVIKDINLDDQIMTVEWDPDF